MLRHLSNKHPSIDTGRTVKLTSTQFSGPSSINPEDLPTARVRRSSSKKKDSAQSYQVESLAAQVSLLREMSTEDRVQARVSQFITRDLPVSLQKALDDTIEIKIRKDYQPKKISNLISFRKRSNVWLHFFYISHDRVQCDICLAELSFKSCCTANLLRHLSNKHPSTDTGRTVKLTGSQVAGPSNINPEDLPTARGAGTVTANSSNNVINLPIASRPSGTVSTAAKANDSAQSQVSLLREMSTKDRVQAGVSQLMTRGLRVSRQKALDDAIAIMICKDYQPLSIVENEGFRHFSHLMNPSYALPSRSTITETIIPRLLKKTLSSIKDKIREASAICLATDSWTSSTNESYIAYTAHFIDERYELKSCLLECSAYTDRHTAENLRDEMYRVATEWDVKNKIVAVVSDNTENITAAIKLTRWTHLPCFAHSLNLTVQEGLKQIKTVQEKVKGIVEYFHRSTVASEKLKLVQLEMGGQELKLKQDVVTRWNSTFHMLKRFQEMKDAIVSTMTLVDATTEAPSAADWEVIDQSCIVLAPFDEITNEISSEQTVSASKVILFAGFLAKFCGALQRDDTHAGRPPSVQAMLQTLTASLVLRFINIENNSTLAEATFLDPRFKKGGFTNATSAEEAVNRLVNMSATILSNAAQQAAIHVDMQSTQSETVVDLNIDDIHAPTAITVNVPIPVASKANSLLWKDFDEKVVNLISTQNPATAAILELRRYTDDGILARTEDPLVWWRERSSVYPTLAGIVKKRLCIVATSVPCDRIFSKTGQTITDRRSRLKPSEVQEITFLNANLPKQ